MVLLIILVSSKAGISECVGTTSSLSKRIPIPSRVHGNTVRIYLKSIANQFYDFFPLGYSHLVLDSTDGRLFANCTDDK